MSTLLITHPACLNHLTPKGHPERPDRLRAIERALEDEKFQTLAREQAPMAELDVIALAHPRDYVEQVRQASPDEGLIGLDADTTMSPGSFEAALLAPSTRLTKYSPRKPRMLSSPFVRPAITPRRRRRWASACSTTWRSRRAMRRKSMAPSVSRSSISTCTTAMAEI